MVQKQVLFKRAYSFKLYEYTLRNGGEFCARSTLFLYEIYIYIFMVEQVRCEIVEIISIKRNLTSIVKKEYCFLIIIDEL